MVNDSFMDNETNIKQQNQEVLEEWILIIAK